MKSIGRFFLMTLLIFPNGCMTYSSVQKAKGQDNVVTGDHPSEAHPWYFALVPLTVPLDIVTSPVQLIVYVVLRSSGTPL